MKCLPIEIIDYVERPEASFVLKYVGHEIHAPGMVEFLRDLQWFLYPCWQAFLHLPSQRKPKGLVNTVHPFMVPWPPFVAQTPVGLPKTFLGMLPGLLLQRLFYLGVVFWQWPIIINALAHIEYTARPADTVTNKFFGNRSLTAGLQSFFSMISLAIWWSNARLAYICLSLRFSSSSSLIRLSSFPLIPAYLERHL